MGLGEGNVCGPQGSKSTSVEGVWWTSRDPGVWTPDINVCPEVCLDLGGEGGDLRT